MFSSTARSQGSPTVESFESPGGSDPQAQFVVGSRQLAATAFVIISVVTVAATIAYMAGRVTSGGKSAEAASIPLTKLPVRGAVVVELPSPNSRQPFRWASGRVFRAGGSRTAVAQLAAAGERGRCSGGPDPGGGRQGNTGIQAEPSGSSATGPVRRSKRSHRRRALSAGGGRGEEGDRTDGGQDPGDRTTCDGRTRSDRRDDQAAGRSVQGTGRIRERSAGLGDCRLQAVPQAPLRLEFRGAGAVCLVMRGDRRPLS